MVWELGSNGAVSRPNIWELGSKGAVSWWYWSGMNPWWVRELGSNDAVSGPISEN